MTPILQAANQYRRLLELIGQAICSDPLPFSVDFLGRQKGKPVIKTVKKQKELGTKRHLYLI